jgi:hypothetical protein
LDHVAIIAIYFLEVSLIIIMPIVDTLVVVMGVVILFLFQTVVSFLILMRYQKIARRKR